MRVRRQRNRKILLKRARASEPRPWKALGTTIGKTGRPQVPEKSG